ncbi:DUF4245 domain-containing protein [Micromonospora sp. CA-249363]|uniref:DUF4245 domain-containing protein n=1 Tax=Micromonospora sp. CA-249363 TaxID=3239963 RepID=UPI003D8DBEAE
MEPAQPADRVPADQTPPDGQTPADLPDAPGAGPAATDAADPTAPTTGEPALVAGAATPVAEPGRVEEGPAARPSPPRAAATARSERSPKDMAISLLVLLIPIALLLAFYRGFLGGDQASTVDPAPAIEQARSANTFPVSEPQGLGSGWRTVSARYQSVEGGATLRIGYLTPEGRGVQLVQSSVPAERLLPAELTDQGQPQGPTELSGRAWQRYTARGNQQALALLEPTRTVLVIGDARDNELRELAGALR